MADYTVIVKRNSKVLDFAQLGGVRGAVLLTCEFNVTFVFRSYQGPPPIECHGYHFGCNTRKRVQPALLRRR